MPFEAVSCLSTAVQICLETERSFGLVALSCYGPGAEDRRFLQLGPDNFGVAAEVAGSRTVWTLVPEELGDDGVTASDGRKDRW